MNTRPRTSIRTSIRTSMLTSIFICASLALAPISPALSASSSNYYVVGTNTVLAVGNEQATIPQELHQFATVVIQDLSQHQLFTHWKGAEPIIEPLGPGTHSWLVTILDQEGNTNGSTSGYLIISVTANGEYKLIEYGIGPDSIYSKSTLDNALLESGVQPIQPNNRGNIIPLYSGPALAAWTIRNRGGTHDLFLDAVTGELLPENENSWNIQAPSYIPPDSALGSKEINPIGHTTTTISEAFVHYADSFDPYDNMLWITGQAINVNQQAFEQILTKKQRLVFVTTGDNRTYSIPLPIYGYQKWTHESISTLYLMSGSTSSPRFISVQALIDAGQFKNYEL